MPVKPHVVVVGAGAFGGWTALNLLRRGAAVTLVDAWGPANARASSSGGTRVIRGTYGPSQPYTKMTAHAMRLWREHEKQWNRRLLHPTGVLWMAAPDDDQFERSSLPLLREAGIAYEELSRGEMAKRWPQINLEGVRWGIYEPDGGYLSARCACEAVRDGFLAEGGEYRQAAVLSLGLDDDRWNSVALSDGSKLKGDAYVFACGPWLSSLFPRTIGHRIRVTKQDMFFFATPAGDDRFSESKLPVWGDHRGHFIYGIPGDPAGFKVADDTRGPEFEPTNGERVASPEGLKVIRDYVGFRFPALKNAPLVETAVCQYENTPDNHFIIDHHPERKDVWLAGGGSGHGFKHGPVVGEIVARLVMEHGEADPLFRLSRFGAVP